MNLFKRHSEKGQMQQKLDRDKTPHGATTVDELALEIARTKSDETRPLFANASEQEPVFNIDLLCGWVKP